MKISVVLLALLFVCCRAAGQQDFAGQAGVAPFADSIVSSGDHLSASPAGIPGKINIPDYLFLISRDFKTALTKPFHMGATDWVIAGKFSLIAVATGFADEPI